MAENVIDFEGQKIHLGEDYQPPGKFEISDVVAMLKEKIVKSEMWSYLEQSLSLNDFYLNLKKGETDAVLIVGISIVIGAYLIYNLGSYMFTSGGGDAANVADKPEVVVEPPRDFTIEQLRENDGTNGKPIYIALRGEVYDVSNASDFYGEGSGYHCFAGREASRAMARLSFEEVDLSNPNVDDLGPFERSTLDDWIQKFKYYKCYPIVGKVSTPPAARDFTREELSAFNGEGTVPEDRVDAPIYIGINGSVIDVSYGGKEMYAKDGPYHIFAGKDASRALAKMSFQPEDLDSQDLSDLTPEQRVVLSDWEKKFVEKRKYPIVGKIVG